MANRRDYLIVGGGLAGGLIALALRQIQPRASVAILEREERPAGNHTWAYHGSDVPPAADDFIRPLAVANWSGYRVRFPGYEREVPSPYSVISAERLASALERGGFEVVTRAEAVDIAADRVEVRDGTAWSGRCVIDARGPSDERPTAAGFQKFVGLEVETDRTWPHDLPMVMDADVAQSDGYRFVYVLPFGTTRVLVEDTYFSDNPQLDRPLLRERIGEYLRSRGVASWRVIREEAGVLPMPWSGSPIRIDPTGPLAAGYCGGWFHPATGYSLPLAVRLALSIAAVPPEQAHTAAASLARRLAPRLRFGRFLNRLLFTLVTPAQRWQVFRRLYRSLPDEAMNRFYACEFGCVDAGRLLLGWPPPLSPLRLIHRPEVRKCPQPSL